MKGNQPGYLLRVFGLVVAISTSLAAQQFELSLSDGTVVRGAVVENRADRVSLEHLRRSENGLIRFTKSYSRGQITTITDLDDAYRKRVSHLDGSVAAVAALSAWCQQVGMEEQAVVHAREAVAVAPDDPTAIGVFTAAGYARVGGTWFVERDFLSQQGLTHVGADIVTIADRNKLTEALAVTNRARQALDAAKAGVVNNANAITSLTSRIETCERQIVALEGKQVEKSTVDAAKKRLDAANSAVTAANRPRRVGRRTVRMGPDSKQIAEQKQAEEFYQLATETRDDQRRRLEKARAQRGALAKQLAELQQESPQRRVAAEKAEASLLVARTAADGVAAVVVRQNPYGAQDIRPCQLPPAPDLLAPTAP